MKEILLTCPFTGFDFKALETSNGDIIVRNPLTDENIIIRKMHDSYAIDASCFAVTETMKLVQAANFLHVTKQRMNAIVASDTIHAYTLADGQRVVLGADVVEYAKKRKNGRPRKCAE